MHSASNSNPNNLPPDVDLAIEQHASNATPATTDDSPDAATIVERLLAIRERLFRLHAVWATTLSPDIAWEADRYRESFRELADVLRKKDVDALDRITSGYESLLLAEPMAKPSIPLALQERFEWISDLRSQYRKPPEKKPEGYLPDGLQRFV